MSSNHLIVQRLRAARQPVQIFEQDVDALVVELVAPRDHQEDGVVHALAEESMRQVGQSLSRLAACDPLAQLVDHTRERRELGDPIAAVAGERVDGLVGFGDEPARSDE